VPTLTTEDVEILPGSAVINPAAGEERLRELAEEEAELRDLEERIKNLKRRPKEIAAERATLEAELAERRADARSRAAYALNAYGGSADAALTNLFLAAEAFEAARELRRELDAAWAAALKVGVDDLPSKPAPLAQRLSAVDERETRQKAHAALVTVGGVRGLDF
jgi:hypothetical protein